MKIILKNADFSANNIGKTDVSLPVSDKTLAMLENYSRQLSARQQSAVETFMSGLEHSGILAKMTTLWLPILAGSAAEATINAATSDYRNDCSLAEYMVVDSLGIRNTNAELKSVSDSGMRIGTSGLLNTDFHFAWYPTTEHSFEGSGEMTDYKNVYLYGSGFIFNPSMYVDIEGVTYRKVHYANAWKVGDVNLIDANLSNISLMEIAPSLKVYDVNAANLASGELLYSPTVLRPTELLTKEPFNGDALPAEVYPTGLRSTHMREPMGIISAGHSLTKEEVGIYANLAKVLVSAMLG